MPCPGHLAQTARRSTMATSASVPPPRSRSPTDRSSSEKRQFRTDPSAVNRSRLHVPQKGWVTLEMRPISPRPSTKRKRSAGARPGPRSTARSGHSAEIVRWTSSPETSWWRAQAPCASRGMNSMNRTTRPVSRANFAKSRTSSSFCPLSSTTLTLSGVRPAASAASMAASTVASWPRRRIEPKRSARSESQLMLTRRRPAAASWSATGASSMPLVVRDRSSSPSAASLRTRSLRPARTRGSPPVSLMDRTPSRRATSATRTISSKESRSDRGRNVIPRSGMQYVHRRLHRSVTEIRRSSWIRPKESTKGPSVGIDPSGATPAAGRRPPGPAESVTGTPVMAAPFRSGPLRPPAGRDR